MAIQNIICDSCNKVEVCKNYDILMKFDENAKKQLGIDITINRCENYDGYDLTGDAENAEDVED